MITIYIFNMLSMIETGIEVPVFNLFVVFKYL